MTGLLVFAAYSPDSGIVTEKVRLNDLPSHVDTEGCIKDTTLRTLASDFIDKKHGIDPAEWKLVHVIYPEFPVARVIINRGRAERVYMSTQHGTIEVSDVDYKQNPTQELDVLDGLCRESGLTRYDFEEGKEGGYFRRQGVSES